MSIDVIVACIEKDVPVLNLCLQSTRIFLEEGVGNIYVVAPESADIAMVTRHQNGILVNENDVFEVKRNDVHCMIGDLDRSGWIFKQLLVLAADKISTSERILILDADTVLIRNHRFFVNDKVTFFVSDELHPPYFKAYSTLLKMPWRFPLSFVSHYMMFERRRLQALRADIERENGQSWYEAILALGQNTQEISFFSEYETYGNYCLFHYPDDVLIQYWNNLPMRRSMLDQINPLIRRYANSHRALSFHSYL